MGTRNLTIVKNKGQIVVAQYGQWDGYPIGQGATIAKFLASADLEKFKEQLAKVKLVNETEQFNRDDGAEILQKIYNGEISELEDARDFKNDSLCEWCYEIDLDLKCVTISIAMDEKIPFSEFTVDEMTQTQRIFMARD